MLVTKETTLLVLVLLALGLCVTSTSGAGNGNRRLRKKPKVYNALITTDDNLTSSRAYPVIQPTIHEPGYAPFGPFNPYGFYSPPLVRFGQPLVPGLPPNERLPYPLPPPAMSYPAPAPAYAPFETNAVPLEREPDRELEPQPVAQAATATLPEPQPEKQEMPKEQLPLNEQGLPPVLIPLPSSQYRSNPVHLPPYPYSQYPVVYDQAGYPREPYLPPYDYYPSFGYPVRGPANPAAPLSPSTAQEQPQVPAAQPQQEITRLPLDTFAQAPSFEDIKNGSESKNRDVPDVPPPPIPSGPKRPRPADN